MSGNELSALQAARKTFFIVCADVSKTCTRWGLRKTAASIFRTFVWMVAAQAWAGSVP